MARFVADENIPLRMILALRAEGHEVTSIFDDERGADDDQVARIAAAEAAILLTSDKGFGGLTQGRFKAVPIGVVLLRLHGLSTSARIQRVMALLGSNVSLEGNLTTLEPANVRQRPL
jgi:predicted nuclease of predicted toxin-antitoxin system